MDIGIVDDAEADVRLLSRLVTDWAVERDTPVHMETFSSAEKFLFRWAEKAFDILLLDVEMGGMDGVTLAKRIREKDPGIQLVFVTGYSDYIAEGYEVSALHYLVKPVDPKKLFSVLDRAAAGCQAFRRVLALDYGGELVRLPLHELRFLQADGNYVLLHTQEIHTVKRSLRELEQSLDDRFFRVGRGLIINLDRIRRISRTEVLLTTGEALPLPRGAYEKLNQAIIAR